MDSWARWLLRDRFGGDETSLAKMLRHLEPIRDRVLEGARIRAGDMVLDVGAGDGLLGFGALERSEPDGAVVFSDVSEDLLETCRDIAAALEVIDRCRFARTKAEHLDGVDDRSVEAVVLRSVLIYVVDKRAAFEAFHRVLRSRGRLSLFEPINRISARLDEGSMFGYDVRSVRDLADKLSPLYLEAVGGEDGPMMGFDATDLVAAAERAGFTRIRAEVEIVQHTDARLGPTDWSTFLGISPNPLAPTVGEAIGEVLDRDEAERLRAHLEPQVVAGTGRWFSAGCYLDAERD